MDETSTAEIRQRVNMQPAEQITRLNKIRWWSLVPQADGTNNSPAETTPGPTNRKTTRERPQVRCEDVIIQNVTKV